MNKHNHSHAVLERESENAGKFLDLTQETAAAFVNCARSAGEDLLEAGMKKGQRLWSKARGKGRNVLKESVSWMAGNPGQAIAYGIALGAALYTLSRLSRQSPPEKVGVPLG